MNSNLHREIARQREAELRREAEHARRVRAREGRSELPGILSFSPVLAQWEGLRLLARNRAQPSA